MRYVNFYSKMSKKYKINVISALIGRSYKLTISKYKIETINKVKKSAYTQQHPSYFITKYINKRIKHPAPKTQNNTNFSYISDLIP